MNTTDRSAIRTQFLVFTLFGDYILPRGGAIWTRSLLNLMGVLGVSERAARSALSRMTRKGWLIARKRGRRSQYSLTARGWALLEQGERRIFEPRFTDWDGLWQVVIYSLPEEERHRRHTLRRRLSWLGFGRLAPSTWVSPHNRKAEVESLCHELHVQAHVELFAGMHQGLSADQALVHRCWDLPGLAAQYRDFITRYQDEYRECLSGEETGVLPEPPECFARRFWLTHDFQPFPLKDPNLPTALLPPGWIGFAARELFDGYRRLLGPRANAFVDGAVADGEEPAARVAEPAPAAAPRVNGNRELASR